MGEFMCLVTSEKIKFRYYNTPIQKIFESPNLVFFCGAYFNYVSQIINYN
ncbi:3942_t:CDS:2 [Gigaspora margarita]|uniref:3942_t:CDS:1 n=1 Tax=Gigaspora margarita TaxID=4874 RepID=A0ABM8W3M1_GIGMA|nr:3942_t:CDS:2 [Gigaspora margarita]